MADTTTAWNTYAQQKPQRRAMNAKGETTWFNWTQFPDHGPGAELLDVTSGDAVLDLGCGTGGNLAHLASLGVRPVGVDLSETQLAAATDRWAEAGLVLHRAEATVFLESVPERFAAIYSVFGAAWFTDPAILLPAAQKALRPGGTFAFSHRPPVEGCYGCQASYITRGDEEDPLVVKRWDYEPGTWTGILADHGFTEPRARVLAAPPGRRKIGTLLVSATA
ncbi:class I SAM-dependent methyltransferase [Streptomyces sp. NPDC058657]|uniref:class I SAM-dependent methyltransferase n=1 Tax=unclassified Streptomyces TaxID=2593676 RepID=UPI0036648F1F